MNVLVVDSNPLIRRVVQNCLAPVRYQILEAADQAASILLRHRQVSILLTAWTMPGGDGGALLRRLRTAPVSKHTYVILFAERDDQALRLVADAVTRTIRQHGAVGHWRGSQFHLVLLATTEQTAAAVEEQVRGRMAALSVQEPAGQRARLSVSLGVISSANGVVPDLPALLQQANQALNKAHVQRGRVASPLFRAAEARAKDG